MNTNKQQQTGRLRIFLKTPKGYLLWILIVLAAIAAFGSDGVKGFGNAAIAIGTALVLDLIVGLFYKKKRFFSDGGLLTGLIVALVLSSTTPWYGVVGTTVIAIISKHVLRIKRKPIFNPAALGLLVASFTFASGQSWWGGLPNLPAWCLLFVVVGGFLLTSRINKFPQVLSFLGVYFGLFLVLGVYNLGDAADALRVPYVNLALFLAFFMLTDPPTSPVAYKDQVWFGVITAIVSVLVYTIAGGVGFLLVGLLVANAWNALRTKEKEKEAKQTKQVSARM